MILEVAIFNVHNAVTKAFEGAYAEASPLIARAKGNLGHEMRRCMETRGRYVLTVRWESLEDHLEGFRKSADFEEWRRLLGAFYSKPPVVEHYEAL
ncbi:MAG TPA: antibiotic biosynthesis monooxygenase [Alphaproteobacteria bacterium]|jgi:heme-degrading monooxygenase HmoA